MRKRIGRVLLFIIVMAGSLGAADPVSFNHQGWKITADAGKGVMIMPMNNWAYCWIENWDPKTFPHGPQWIANYIKSKGLCPGLWLVPNAYAGATKQHPEWYLYDKTGNFIWDYSTPSLDSTLKKMFWKEKIQFA